MNRLRAVERTIGLAKVKNKQIDYTYIYLILPD